MKRLIVVGDRFSDPFSVSYGPTIKKVDDGTKVTSILETKFPLWPTILGEKLGMETINLSQAGTGNDHHLSVVLDTLVTEKNKEDIGLVIVTWSGVQRLDFELETAYNNVDKISHDKGELESNHHFFDWDSVHCRENIRFRRYPDTDQCSAFGTLAPSAADQSWKDTIRETLRDNDMFTERMRVKKFLRLVYTFQQIMKNENLDYFSIGTIFPRPSLWPEPELDSSDGTGHQEMIETIFSSDYYDAMDEETCLGWPMVTELGGFDIDKILAKHDPTRKTNRVDGDVRPGRPEGWITDVHPNKLGHEQIADFLYDEYRKVYAKTN